MLRRDNSVHHYNCAITRGIGRCNCEVTRGIMPEHRVQMDSDARLKQALDLGPNGDRIVESEMDTAGDCAVCGARFTHVPQCATLQRRRREIGPFNAPFVHLNYLPRVLQEDLEFITKRDQEYGASWLKRGGVGAMMMLLRKSDRLEEGVKGAPFHYDVFTFLEANPERIDDIDDLRRYLALVRAEWDRRQAAQHMTNVLSS